MSGSVLCAVDVSNKSNDLDVLRQAGRLADLDDAQLDVITVVPGFGMSAVGDHFDEGHHAKMTDEAKTSLEELVIQILGAERSDAVRCIVASGKTYEEILSAAKAAGTTLIVIGANKTDLKDYLLGPNAARVVRHSECSVHVVR